MNTHPSSTSGGNTARTDCGKFGRIASGNHLVAVNDEPEPQPRYIRQPERDSRTRLGHCVNGNAWLDTHTGATRLFCMGYDANDSWVGYSNLARRAAIDNPKGKA